MKAMRLLPRRPPNRAAQPARAKPMTEPLRNLASADAFKRTDARRYASIREELCSELDRLSAALAEAADGQQRQELVARRRHLAYQVEVLGALLAPPER